MTTWGTAIGTLIAVGLVAAFPITLAKLPEDPDLQVQVPGSRPFVVREDAKRSLPALKILPVATPDGLSSSDSATGSGLGQRTWQVTYSHRWEREVTMPILTGPFVHEGEEVCGLSASLGAGLFDTSGAGAGFSSMLKEELSAAFPRTEKHERYPITIQFPGVADATVRFHLGNGGVGVFADIHLLDGTRFVIFFPVAVVSRDGTPALVLKGERLSAHWSGPTYDELLLKARALGVDYYGHPDAKTYCPLDLFDWFCPSVSEREQMAAGEAETTGQQMVHDQIAERITAAFDKVNLGFASLRGPHHPIAGNATASVSLRLSASPVVSSKGITLRLCAAVQIGKKLDPSISGSVRTGASPLAATPSPTGDSSIELSADGETLNHLLYFMWQSAALRELGTSRSVVQAALDGTRDADGSESALQKLAFEFKGFDPGLPPTIGAHAKTPGSIGFTLGDVKIGDWDERRVVAHASGALALDSSGDRVTLTAVLNKLTANCTAPSGKGIALSPCVSDLLPAVRDALVGKNVQVSVPGGDVLAKLPAMFGGGQMQLTKLQATTSASPIRVSLKVQARITGAAP
jgi:hypothetical protein